MIGGTGGTGTYGDGGGAGASLFFASVPVTQTFYAVVGGNGASAGSSDPATVAGGYNGGGTVVLNSAKGNAGSGGAGGGGATDIRTLDPTASGSLYTRLYVAGGGGGGGTFFASGGSAGLETGTDGASGRTDADHDPGSGGSQTAGGSPNGAFGVGGNGNGQGAGGGGWYGGGGGGTSSDSALGGGGGGSSYVGGQVATFGLTTATPMLQFTYDPCYAATPAPPDVSARARRSRTAVVSLCPKGLKDCPLPSGSYECVFEFEDCEA
ncbi:hypothetical protein MNV49_004565 [Pseudohyphozyma bogoriensis]|nr:hypothetical protein MNV49_004565 [Pseudohyphozyma bogoriensis]